jgi:hypothetical protein
MRIWL